MIDISISDLDKNEISYREIDLKLERLTTYIKRAMTRSKKIKTLSSTAQNKASVQKLIAMQIKTIHNKKYKGKPMTRINPDNQLMNSIIAGEYAANETDLNFKNNLKKPLNLKGSIKRLQRILLKIPQLSNFYLPIQTQKNSNNLVTLVITGT